MRHFVMALALTCVLSSLALAGDVPSVGITAQSPAATGEIPTVGIALSLIQTLLGLL